MIFVYQWVFKPQNNILFFEQNNNIKSYFFKLRISLFSNQIKKEKEDIFEIISRDECNAKIN